MQLIPFLRKSSLVLLALALLAGGVVLLGIAGRGDTEKYLEEVPLRVKAKTVIPVHIDNFFKPIGECMSFLPASINFNEFCEAAGRYRSDFTVRTLPLARSVRILPVNGR